MNMTKNVHDNLRSVDEQRGWYLLFAAWLVAAVALLGSLFLDYVIGIEPCPLCWYQRVFMYPLVPVLLVGLYPLDRRAVRYALPLALLGWLVALYHLLLYIGVIPEPMQPCGADLSCTQAPDIWPFLNIPLLSLVSFTAIIGLLLQYSKRTSP